MTDCTHCTHWRLKEAGRMAKQGMGNCAHLPKYQFVAIGCARLKPAAPAVVAARLAYFNQSALAPQGGRG